MSKYSELLGFLKEDVDKMVEQRVAERMDSIIEALYPSILEHVANSLEFVIYGMNKYQQVRPGLDCYELLKPEMDFMHLQMATGPGTFRQIGPAFPIFDKEKYGARIEYIYKYINETHQRMTFLESQVNILNAQANNASKH